MADDKPINGHKPDRLMQSLGVAGGVGVPDLPQVAEAAVAALTGLRAEIPDNARTAEMLGTEREGNAIVIDETGLVVTIGYLMLECGALEIADCDGRWVEGEFVAYDYETGFGLARAAAPLGITPAPLGDGSKLVVGSKALVAGRGGRESAMAVRVASRRAFSGYWEYHLDEAIYTAPAYPNWSGAALIGGDGRVGGVGSLLVEDAVENRASQGNLFVPMSLLTPILPELVSRGRVDRPPRPWLGMFTAEAQGALVVTHVSEGGPAKVGGVRAGDVVLRVDREPVADLADLYAAIWGAGTAGMTIPLTIVREGAAVELMIRSADRYDVYQTPSV